MAQISINNLTFCYEGSFDTIFENVSFSIDTNWKLGFIGRNGKGKTTLLNLLLGKYSYEGSIDTTTIFDYFPYPITENQMQLCAADFIEEIKPGCETWRVICELKQMEESAELLYRPYVSLSHGERTKILLAVLFSGENDFLLIDEPTNHLDQEAREVVKGYLSSKNGFILVSHDRDLLDACIDHVLVLNRKTIEIQSGNFSSWWENKQRKDQFDRAENEKHQREIKKLKQAATRTSDWADKNEHTKIGFDPVKENDRSINARAFIGAKTKKMQSRVKQIEKRMEWELKEKEGLLKDIENPVDLKLMPLVHHKNVLVNIKDYSLKYSGAGSPVFTDLTFAIQKGERIALHGKNGCGKSTLLKRILEKIDMGDVGNSFSEKGICEIASGLVVSYVPQDTASLKGGVSEFCKERNLNQSLFCSILRQLDFERVQFLKNMEDYSEGQKKKVLLAASLLTSAHLYIWDEPLNYIDVFSRMQIEKLLKDYQPTMLFVEHDIRFCETIATRIIPMSD
ncbi:MAG: ABC-F type ribosomal protection protein [Bacteroides sp.]|nr:ABC-F type ribosomal protection protein [Bacteroides sp.]MCM1550882.1 ABC-F type ribosomal protection protein [Clostridium sp.]